MVRLAWCLLSNFSCCSTLKGTRGPMISCKPVQVYHYHLPPLGAAKSFESGQCSHIYGSYFVCHLYFRFRRDQPLHNIQSLIFCSLTEVPTIWFVTRSSTVFL
jgi:hypothetical protein